jgi:hypothetical protein
MKKRKFRALSIDEKLVSRYKKLSEQLDLTNTQLMAKLIAVYLTSYCPECNELMNFKPCNCKNIPEAF